MHLYLVLLLVGFGINLASAFTSAFSRRWGERRGSIVTFLLRNILGIPVWAAGFVLAVHTPLPALFAFPEAIRWVGWFLIAIGGVLIAAALFTLRRRAAIPTTRDSVARTGLYTHMRHPIHTGTFLEFVGLFLLVPTRTVAIACAMGIVWILLQTWCEERDLFERLPDYCTSMRNVPRFIPRLRKR